MKFPTKLLCLALTVTGAAHAEESAPIAIKAAHVFDAVTGHLADNGAVLVQDGKIKAVGSDQIIPADAKVIDLGSATLLPGFIDAHVHMDSESSDNWYKEFYDDLMRFPAERAVRATRYAKETLEAGFTTVRDLGSDDWISLGLRNAINAGIVEGPRMLIANHAISSTGGHADQAPFPPETVAPATPIKGVCNGPDECRAARPLPDEVWRRRDQVHAVGRCAVDCGPGRRAGAQPGRNERDRLRSARMAPQGGCALPRRPSPPKWRSAPESIRSSTAASSRTTRWRK